MVTKRNLNRVAMLCLLTTALTGEAELGADTQNDTVEAIPYPGVSPIIPDPKAHVNLPVVIDQTLMEDLKAPDFPKREAAAERLILIGLPAIPALQDLALTADDDVLWWIRAITQNITQSAGKEISGSELFDLLAQGPTDQVMATLKALPPPSLNALLEKHLQLEVGMDCIYSLNPSLILPRAVELLQVQDEPFYQAILLRLIRNVLERTLLPLPNTATSSDPKEGMVFSNTFSNLAKTVQKFLTAPHPQLRREALLILAWGNQRVNKKGMQDLLTDPFPVVAREACRLQRLLATDAVTTSDPCVASWINECIAALSQDDDHLAQLGAYYALYEMVYHFPSDLTDAAAVLGESRAKDAVVWLLSQDAGGRAHLLCAGWERLPKSSPATLQKLLTLRAYDLQRENLTLSRDSSTKATLALVWRNLVNDDACGYSSISRQSTRSKPFFDELETFGHIDLGKSTTSKMRRPRGIASTSEFKSWYDACARNALSSLIPISTGAIRGLFVSDLAGARALVKHYRKLVANDSRFSTGPALPRDLILLHPCIDLLTENELPLAIRALWHKRRIEITPISGGGERPKLNAFPYDVPLALWGFFMQNDCSYMNPAGHYLAGHLSMEHLPLLLAFLEYNPRATIFLAELDAHESKAAITREIYSRRKSYYCSYDHDLFHGVAHFGILDAAPILETYTKQNDNWPGKGVMTLAGFEYSRYCWTEETEAATPTPLTAGILREIASHLQAGRDTHKSSDYRIGEFCDKGLKKMKVPMK